MVKIKWQRQSILLVAFAVSAIVASVFISNAVNAQQVNDSTGYSGGNIQYGDTVYSSEWNRVGSKPETATRWPEWDEVAEKPETAIRWPSWNEVNSKPTFFNPAPHSHSNYVDRINPGVVYGPFEVDGEMHVGRIKTDDVDGDRWCRATSSGIIRCIHDKPTSSEASKGAILGGARTDDGGPGGLPTCNSWGEAVCGGSPHGVSCPSGSARRTSGIEPYANCGSDDNCSESKRTFHICVKS